MGNNVFKSFYLFTYYITITTLGHVTGLKKHILWLINEFFINVYIFS
jgi:hypothetical protein